MLDNAYLAERDAQIRRQADERYAENWRLAKLARPRPRRRFHVRLQVRDRLADLTDVVVERVNQWLAGSSGPQKQCC